MIPGEKVVMSRSNRAPRRKNAQKKRKNPKSGRPVSRKYDPNATRRNGKKRPGGGKKRQNREQNARARERETALGNQRCFYIKADVGLGTPRQRRDQSEGTSKTAGGEEGGSN